MFFVYFPLTAIICCILLLCINVLKSVCVCVWQAGEDDALLDMNKKMAGEVCYFIISAQNEYTYFIPNRIPNTYNRTCPFRAVNFPCFLLSQVGLNVMQICLPSNCSQEEVRQWSRTNLIYFF